MTEASIIVDTDGEVKIARIVGQLDESNVDEKVQDLYKIVEEEPKGLKLVLDLAQLEYMNSKSIGYITDLYGKITESGGKVAIAQSQPNILDILQVVGLTQLIENFDTLEGAKASVMGVEVAAAPTEPTPTLVPEAPVVMAAEPTQTPVPEVPVEVAPTPTPVAEAPQPETPAEIQPEAMEAAPVATEPSPVVETPAPAEIQSEDLNITPAEPTQTPVPEVPVEAVPAPTPVAEAPVQPEVQPTPETKPAPENSGQDGTYKFEG